MNTNRYTRAELLDGLYDLANAVHPKTPKNVTPPHITLPIIGSAALLFAGHGIRNDASDIDGFFMADDMLVLMKGTKKITQLRAAQGTPWHDKWCNGAASQIVPYPFIEDAGKRTALFDHALTVIGVRGNRIDVLVPKPRFMLALYLYALRTGKPDGEGGYGKDDTDTIVKLAHTCDIYDPSQLVHVMDEYWQVFFSTKYDGQRHYLHFRAKVQAFGLNNARVIKQQRKRITRKNPRLHYGEKSEPA